MVLVDRLTPKAATAFAARWQLVADAERQELQSTPLQRKLEQLAALMVSARALGWETTDAREVEAVRTRWLRLAARLGHV
jgi:hypothetical protein